MVPGHWRLRAVIIVIAAVVVLSIVAAPDVESVARGIAVAAAVAWCGLRLVLHRPQVEPTSLLPATLDMALTVTVLLLIPLLGIPGLFVILLLTARLAALRGFRGAAVIGMAAVVIVSVRAALIPDMTGDLWFLVGMFGATTIATAAIIDRVVSQRDVAMARLARIEVALEQVAGDVGGDDGSLLPALARATSQLVHDVRGVQVLLAEAIDQSPTAVVALASGELTVSSGHPVETAVPLKTGASTVGVLLAVSDAPLAAHDQLLLRLWADRTATAVLLDRSRQREAEARVIVERAAQLRDELVARVSHDLKVPLATVVGASRTLARHGDQLEREQIVGLHEMLDRNTARLQRWVDEMFEEAAEGRVRPLNLDRRSLHQAITESVEASAEALRAHRVDLQVEHDVVVLADEDAVLRVVTNLLSNAAKFSPQGTRIRVIAEVDGDDVIVTVQDEGPGIPTEDLEQIFDPWARRGHDTQVDGAGLGLSTVRSLVQRWGGRVWAESPGRQGARLRFTLPLLQVGELDLHVHAVEAAQPA